MQIYIIPQTISVNKIFFFSVFLVLDFLQKPIILKIFIPNIEILTYP